MKEVSMVIGKVIGKVIGRGNEVRVSVDGEASGKLVAYRSKQWVPLIGTPHEKVVREAIFSCSNEAPAEDLAREINRRIGM